MTNFKAGDRVVLEYMGYDPHPIEVGTQGTVDGVDGLGTIHVTWDNGRSLGVIPNIDRIRKI